MNRLQDSVVDDDEESCPLCIEEFDLSDKNFKPCPCGYQICQFCFNSLKTTYEKSTCPNCRRVYDEKTIQYKIPTAEEFKLDQQAKNRKQAAAKRKETEKKEVETSSRRNLAGVRVKQQNLVYVIGLVPDLKDEPKLLQTLRGKDYFGQYGEIEKIVVSKAKPGVTTQGVGVYVTFARKEDAAVCINAIDGSKNEERVLRAQYGTTKYCSAYLRSEDCNNKNCSFLHETGEDGQDTTLQNEQINKIVSRPNITSQPLAQPISRPPLPQSIPSSQQMARQPSSDKEDSRKGSIIDNSALPSSASWANATTSGQPPKSRRASQVAARPSPPLPSTTLVTRHADESNQKDAFVSVNKTIPNNTRFATQTSTTPAGSTSQKNLSRLFPRSASPDPHRGLYEKIAGNLSFSFDESLFSPEAMAQIKRMPKLIDPCGGLKLRIRKDREAAEQAKYDAELQAKIQAQAQEQVQADELPIDTATDDENVVGGSFALGGEPEEDARSASTRGTIQRPSQSGAPTNFVNEAFANMNGSSRSLTPQQREQMGLAREAPGTGHSAQSDVFDFDRRGSQYQSQAQYDSMSTHQRHPSRYFNNAENSKSNAPAPSRYQGQSSFYTSGVQGPPPGLKTAGTPPISGGGMFSHGQGFTSNVNASFGAKDSTVDMFSRGRSGTGSGHDIAKREFLLSLQKSPLRSPLQAPGPALLNSLYGPQIGAYQDPGLVKQKKKGKKHRHANTSSSGGGAVDHADPNPLQSRVNQSSASTGQGLFSGQNQGDEDFPPLPGKRLGISSRISSIQTSLDLGLSTPKLPPGLDLSHAHPELTEDKEAPTGQTRTVNAIITPGPITPAVPLLPIGPLAPGTKPVNKEDNPEEKQPKVASDAESSRIMNAPTPGFESDYFSVSPLKTKPQQKEIEVSAEAEPKSLVQEIFSNEVTSSTEVTSKPTVHMSEGKPPEKLDFAGSVTIEPVSQGLTKNAATVASSELIGTPSISGSRPATPATTGSDTPSKTSARPRTIRVVTTMSQKVDHAPASDSAVTEKSASIPMTVHIKQRSRQPSVSSVSHSRPSTPAVSEAFSYDFSRASTPPGIIGTAPERTNTKTQQRKLRKSKKTTETADESSVLTAAVPVEEVAPVISRQRKQKKRGEPSSAMSDKGRQSRGSEAKESEEEPKFGSTATSTQKDSLNVASKINFDTEKGSTKPSGKPKRTDSKKLSASATPKELDPETPVLEEPPRPPYTLRDLYNDAAKHSETPQLLKTLMGTNISPMNKIFSSLLFTKEIEQLTPFFNPAQLSSYRLPADSRRGNDYLDGNGYTDSNPFGMIYLTQDKKRAIQNGHTVRISDTNKSHDLLRRAMVSPSGTVWRHLSESEEERVLQLEEQRELFVDEWGPLKSKLMNTLARLEDNDYMNLEGGMEELSRFGEAHGVSWVLQDGDEEEYEDVDGDQSIGQPFGMAEDDDLPSDDDTDDLGLNEAGVWAAAQALGTVPKNAHIANQANVLPPMRMVAPSTLTNLNPRNMDPEMLAKHIVETQRDVDATRKEAEKAEKAWAKKSREVAKWMEATIK